ncbi:MAG: hypothetical protein A2W08_05205 [Candidatus Rokubacteria bacterium RBG_16_73_20]|nr:MAG: hypothetical protein A2W08_05205 [Candidatus Rokubacteria bacterium RBG_16_73_20]
MSCSMTSTRFRSSAAWSLILLPWPIVTFRLASSFDFRETSSVSVVSSVDSDHQYAPMPATAST